MKLLTYLNQPFPVSINRWKVILPISIFIGLFMIVFQPFGLREAEHQYQMLILSGYGIVTFLVLLFNLFLLPAVFQGPFEESRWTVLKQIAWLAWILFTIGLGNLGYSLLIFNFQASFWQLFFIFQLFTLAVGIIPVVTVTVIEQNYLLKKYAKEALMLDQRAKPLIDQDAGAGKTIQFLADNNKDTLSIPVADILFIESSGNYIKIHEMKGLGISSHLLRCTMKRAEQQIHKEKSLFRCHRAFIVNMDKIEKIKGNSQGYRLKLEGYDDEIPVSRNFLEDFKKEYESD